MFIYLSGVSCLLLIFLLLSLDGVRLRTKIDKLFANDLNSISMIACIRLLTYKSLTSVIYLGSTFFLAVLSRYQTLSSLIVNKLSTSKVLLYWPTKRIL